MTKPAAKLNKGTSKKRVAQPQKTTEVIVGPPLNSSALERFLALKHHGPHQILGPHPSPQGLVIRAFRPDAEKIEVVIGRKRPQLLEKIDGAGLFEILIPELDHAPAYRFRVSHPDGTVLIQRDPYAFLPTLGDLDLHLFAEGRHEQIYQKLGAHIRTVERVKGVSFAVWAPQAEGVSVVGDFNRWDGRLHQMRLLGGSGVWELFIPELEAGALYKFEIRAGGWLPFLKTDPFAAYTEIPPRTS